MTDRRLSDEDLHNLETCYVEDPVLNAVAEVKRLRAENARLDAERREAHVFLTGKFEIGWCMTHPDSDEADTELGKAAKMLLAEKRRLEALLRARGIDPQAGEPCELRCKSSSP